MRELKSTVTSSTFYTTSFYRNDHTLPADLRGSHFYCSAFISIAGITIIIRMLILAGIKGRTRCGPSTRLIHSY